MAEFPKDIIQQIENVQKESNTTGLFRKSSNGNVTKSLYNLRVIISMLPIGQQLGFDEFARIPTINKRPIDEMQLKSLRVKIDDEYNLKFVQNDIEDVVMTIAQDKPYHPIKEFIEAKPWDGVKRVETLFIDYLGATDDEYNREVAKRWLCGGIARIYYPGIKFEIVPILEGSQGAGKSTLAGKLAGKYFVDTLKGMGQHKDDNQLLIGAWIVELSELASLRKSEIENTKGFLSSSEDKVRLPYEKNVSTLPRTNTFIGTTNATEYLTDFTGNRRFFPIPLEADSATKSPFDMTDDTIQQIWAEAKHLYFEEKAKIHVDRNEAINKIAETYRGKAQFKGLDIEEIENYLNMPVSENWNNLKTEDKRKSYLNYQNGDYFGSDHHIERTTTKEILSVVFNLDASYHQAQSKYSKIKGYMDNQPDWSYQTVRINGKPEQGYKRE